MSDHDGDGWVDCSCGQRHWGLHGAAGLVLLRESMTPAGAELLLQLRAGWTHEGGSWGLPGGARDSHEDVVTAALREAWEEAGVPADLVSVLGARVGVDHGDWRYTYVLATTSAAVLVSPRTAESDELRWVGLDDVQALPLHPSLARSWAGLRADLATELATGPGAGSVADLRDGRPARQPTCARADLSTESPDR